MAEHLKPSSCSNGRDGFALVITLIMVVLAAVIAVALLTNASAERATANAYNRRIRAEMAAQSGLARALNALAGATVPIDFRFITAAGDDGKPVLIPLAPPDPAGIVSLDTASKRLLYSDSATPGASPATITLSTVTTPRVTRQVGYVPITDASNQEVERYAFYVDESGSRQNLGVQGPTQSPTPRPRVYARDPNELPLVTTASPSPSSFSSNQLAAINDKRPLLFTTLTANPVLSEASALANPAIDDYSYATASTAANVSPEGKPRVNLTKLKAYVDGLPVSQANGNPRAALVDRLLNPAETGTEWDGGNLSILTKLPRYPGAKAKQIVANLLDYIDSDLIPTTDNVDNPTYFGVEGRADANGNVVGHPYINFVGTGLVFNRSSASGFAGGLNSTRVLVVLGLVNPWNSATKDWSVFYVKPEMQIAITGDASGGNQGSSAQSYFHSDFNTTDSSNQLLTFPVATIAPNTGYSFPAPGSSSSNYANFYDLLNTSGVGRQPPAMNFSNIGFRITKLRLKFTDTDGRFGYVQVLDGLELKALPVPPGSPPAQPANPSTMSMGTSGGSLVYKFASGAPNKTDFHLNSDPRLSFTVGTWMLSRSTENGASPPTPSTAVDVFSAASTANWDFAAQAPSVKNHLWYTNASNSKNFFAKSPPIGNTMPSPPPSPPSGLLDSAGELGFIHTGLPWETLRLYVTGGEQNGKERDRELLAYVHSGTFPNADYGTMPLRSPTPAPAPSPVPLVSGLVNANTNKRPTLQTVFLGATAVSDTDATARANGSAADPDAAALADTIGAHTASPNTLPFALPGDFLALPGVMAVTNAATNTTDFNREILARRTANVLGTHSTRFTVYSLGEARDKAGATTETTGTVSLRAEVEMQLDSNGKPTPKVLSTAYYTTQ